MTWRRYVDLNGMLLRSFELEGGTSWGRDDCWKMSRGTQNFDYRSGREIKYAWITHVGVNLQSPQIQIPNKVLVDS
jgi:hypothetical protein